MAESKLQLADIFRVGFQNYVDTNAPLPPQHYDIANAILRCHTAAMGGHVFRCTECGSDRISYNSCRNRHCPSCQAMARARWVDERTKELLPVPYFHVVFTVPRGIAGLALGNKKILYAILFRAASRTLLDISRDPRHLGADIGFLAVLHTWTQTLLHHPHVHCVVPGGGLSRDGERWISCNGRFFLPVRVLSQVFRGKFLELMTEAAGRGELRFHGSTASLAGKEAWSRFIAEMRRTSWVVYAKPPFGSPDRVLKYLAGYTHRVAISNRRIVAAGADGVAFSYRDRAHGDVTRTMTLAGDEFLRRFLLHVLPKAFVRIRHFGFLASRARARRLALCRALLSDVATTAHGPAVVEERPGNAVVEPGTHLCPSCGAGQMHFVSVVDPDRVSSSSFGALGPRRDTS